MKRILFIELLGGIGDVFIALPAIQAVARSHPHAHLTVLTLAPGGTLLESDPLLDRLLYANLRDSSPGYARRAIEHLLNDESFDLIISDTNYDGIAELIQASAPRSVTNLWRSPPPQQFVSDRFLQILLDEGVIHCDAIAPPYLEFTVTEQAQAQTTWATVPRPIVLLYPDAGMAIKRWSPQNFIELGQALQRQYGATIVVPVGSDSDGAAEIVSQIGGTAHLWQPSPLREFAAMISQATLMIAADTGPARIAAAIGVPTITLFGPSWHQRYGQPAPHVNLQGDADCPERVIANFTVQSCWYGGECPVKPWATCLEGISVADVLRVTQEFLA